MVGSLCFNSCTSQAFTKYKTNDLLGAVKAQYVAIKIDDINQENGREKYFKFNGKSYKYNKVNLGNYDNPAYYWVRDGYTVKIEKDKRFPKATTDVVVKVYKQNENVNDAGLLQSYQTLESDGKITTQTGYNIQNADTGVFGGAVNTSRTDTPWYFGYNIDLKGNGSYDTRVINTNNNVKKYFRLVSLENGRYKYNGEDVPIDNMYVIGNTLGVFVDDMGKLYTGNVYGDNNEVLMTAVGENNKYYSYWGAEIEDPKTTIGKMTISEYNMDRQEIINDVKGIYGDNIKDIQITPLKSTNGGSISLKRNGQYDESSDSYKGDYFVPGTVEITSMGDFEEKDIKIKVANKNNKGEENSFTINAGSKVIANEGKEGDELESLSINGKTFNIVTQPITGEISSNGILTLQQGKNTAVLGKIKDWSIVKGELKDNNLVLTTKNNYNNNETKSIEIKGLASLDYVDKKDGLNVKYDNDKKDKITLNPKQKAVVITNVENGLIAKDSKEAVNGGQLYEIKQEAMNKLDDTIQDAIKENGSIANSDKHLVENENNKKNGHYTVSANNDVDLIVKDKLGNKKIITIDNIAKANDIGDIEKLDQDLKSEEKTSIVNAVNNLNNKVGKLNYSQIKGDNIADNDNTTIAIGKLNNKLDQVNTSLQNMTNEIANNSIVGGKINQDGSISVTQNNKTKQIIKLEGKLTDSMVNSVDFDKAKGQLTIQSIDKYDKNKINKLSVSGIASKEDTNNITDNIIGTNTKEKLISKYKDDKAKTKYIVNAQSMIDADIKLDQAIQNVANINYNTGEILNNRINNMESRLNNVEKRIDKVGAMAAAIANLRTMGYDPLASTEIAMGVGQYKNETGIAIGIFHYPNQDFMLNASIAYAENEFMGGIGATWKIGRKNKKELVKDINIENLAKKQSNDKFIGKTNEGLIFIDPESVKTIVKDEQYYLVVAVDEYYTDNILEKIKTKQNIKNASYATSLYLFTNDGEFYCVPQKYILDDKDKICADLGSNMQMQLVDKPILNEVYVAALDILNQNKREK
ncbi:YadA-like family protein [Megamonas funiformis]|uniref:YadA-like family protein n=1 Tax=Megamonas funiformis TaxID=437897 RepID=UPI0024ADD2EA|nr:YadA-like family protein [Megamonas funiformis]